MKIASSERVAKKIIACERSTNEREAIKEYQMKE
jgi:hypothetical protein